MPFILSVFVLPQRGLGHFAPFSVGVFIKNFQNFFIVSLLSFKGSKPDSRIAQDRSDALIR